MTRLPDTLVYLVPLGRDRYELYTEPADDRALASDPPEGFFRSRVHRVRQRWNEAVQTARRGEALGRWARLRDWAVCRASETIAEQRTLWSLRGVSVAELWYPSDLSNRVAT